MEVVHVVTLLGRFRNARLLYFGMVGTLCFAVQQLILHVLTDNPFDATSANSIGFVASAQLNFMLSRYLTWRDRRSNRFISQWAKFNVTVLSSLVVNTMVFYVLYTLTAVMALASAIAVIIGTGVSYVANNLMTFQAAPQGEQERVPPVCEVQEILNFTNGVAFFLPAYNEAANLPATVQGLANYFRELRCRFTIIIVDDGSTDNTREVVEQLIDSVDCGFFNSIKLVQHQRNRGYGAALRTGIKAALGTDHDYVAFCDADGQFQAASLGTLLSSLIWNRADVAVGYRINRADSLKRKLMGKGWHFLSRLVLGFAPVARDVDCGFKVFSRKVLEKITDSLCGDNAVISPELLARISLADFAISEAGLTHLTRQHGTQTGASLKVVIRSIVQLFELRRILKKEEVQV